MKILLLCAGGFSTSIVMKKIRKWAEENGEEITVDAKAKESYENIWEDYDCILVGPQISYVINEIKENVKIPVAGIHSVDYAIGNAENIIKLAKSIIDK